MTKCSSLVVTLDHYYEDYKNGNITVKQAAKEATSSMVETMEDSSKFEVMLADYASCKDNIFIHALIVAPYAESYTADLLRSAGRNILGKEIQ